MGELRPVEIIVDGRTIELTEDNHGVAMFRDEPEKDYLDITELVEDEEAHTLVFRHRFLLLWMGRVVLQEQDQEILDAMEDANGLFRDRTGFNSRVFVEDHAGEFETETYTRSLLTDLNKAEGLPDDWS